MPWPYSSDLWCLDDPKQRITLTPEQLRFANELRRVPDGTPLLYGYPTYIEASRTVIPLFTRSIGFELRGSRELWLYPIPEEWPQINPEYLKSKRVAPTEEEQRDVLDTLGLLDPTGDPPDDLISDVLERMKEMGLLQDLDLLEPLDPQVLSPFPQPPVQGPHRIANCAGLFAVEGPRFTAGLIRELQDMVSSGAPGWERTALATVLGEQEGVIEEEHPVVEVVPLNEEQREAVRRAITSPLTAVTGPPGTGKSQIVVSLIADAYMRGSRVLFTSKNNKAVDVVEDRVADLAAKPLMIRTGSRGAIRNFPHELAQRLAEMLASRPSDDDRLKYDELKARCDELQRKEGNLWAELQQIRLAYDNLRSRDKDKAGFEEQYTPHKWESLEEAKGLPDSNSLKNALQLADQHVTDSDIPFNYFSRLDSVSDKLTMAMQLVDKHSKDSNIPFRDFSDLQSASNRLATALQLVDKHINLIYFLALGSPPHRLTTESRLAYTHVTRSGMPVNYHAVLSSFSGRLKIALQLANKHIVGSDTLYNSFSLWRSKKKDRRRIQSVAFEVAAEFRVLDPCPSEDQSFQTWRTWLMQTLSVIDALEGIAIDRERVESIVADTVAEYPVFDQCPTEGQSFQAWRAWLVKALAFIEKLEAADKDRKQIQNIVADAVAECPAFDPYPAEEPSFEVWRGWLMQALSVVRKLNAIHKDRKRIQSIATEAVDACSCSLLSPVPTEDQPFQDWRKWLTGAISIAEALEAIAAYRGGLAALRELRSRDEVARCLRRVRDSMADSGAELIALYAKLAPTRLRPKDRQAIGEFRAIQERLAEGGLSSPSYSRLMRDMEQLFPNISRHIPAWCVTNLSARSSRLPLKPNLFDLLIIDEASQCDIASALPLLYRSKRAVIIGDPFQLRHITKIEQHKDDQLQTNHGLDDHILRNSLRYSTNSLYNLASGGAAIDAPIPLQDHYRSHSHIVKFSNREWYQDSPLRVWTNYARLKPPPDEKYGIRWTEVSGTAKRHPEGSVFISSEIEAVVGQVADLLVNQKFDGTLGVVTPFRAQANIIHERIRQRVPADMLDRTQFVVDTAHKFQGDERDIILFSPCISRDLPSGSRNFLKNTENLFNVAITRARSLLHIVGSRKACANSEIPHIQRFAEYCSEIERSMSSPYETTLASDHRVGSCERPLYDALVAKGLNPMPQHPVNQYLLDLAITCGEIRIDVEADGVATHLNSRMDAERDSRLTELGWRVIRFWNHQIRDDLDYCVETVLKAIQKG